MFAFGLGYRVSPFFRVSSGVYYLKDRNRSANRSTSIVLGADYELSKHTTLYAQGGASTIAARWLRCWRTGSRSRRGSRRPPRC